MTPETEATAAWLGALEIADREVRADFRNLATAPSPAPLAGAMRQYVEQPIGTPFRQSLISSFGDNAVAQVDFDAIAARTQARIHRFARPAPTLGSRIAI